MKQEAASTPIQKNRVKLFLFILGAIILLLGLKTSTTGETLTGGTFVLIGIGFIVVSEYI